MRRPALSENPGVQPRTVRHGECGGEFELLAQRPASREVRIERGARIIRKQRPGLLPKATKTGTYCSRTGGLNSRIAQTRPKAIETPKVLWRLRANLDSSEPLPQLSNYEDLIFSKTVRRAAVVVVSLAVVYSKVGAADHEYSVHNQAFHQE